MVAWGPLIGGVASAAAGIYGAKKSASAAKSAAGMSRKQYQQTREDLAPWRGPGGSANYELAALYGMPGLPGGAGPVIDEQGNPAPVNAMAGMGRGGDTEVAHVTPGEAVIPQDIIERPRVRNALRGAFADEGADFSRYIVGSGRNSRNPRTGAREFLYGGDTSEGGATGFSRDEQEGRDTRRSVADVYDRITPEWMGPEIDNFRNMQTFEEVRSAYPRSYGPGRQGDGRGGVRGGRNALRNFGGAGVGGASAPGLPEGYYSQENAINRFYDSPDYRLAFDEGAGAIERSAAGRGGLFGGNTGAALTKYGQQLGGQRYNDYYSHLMGLSGLGQNAAAQTGNVGVQTAGMAGNAMMGAGNAYAGAGYGVGNAINRGIENYWLMNMLGGAS